jgi:peptidoglycan hydrolase-like protein with peptidoglycan-binding domain
MVSDLQAERFRGIPDLQTMLNGGRMTSSGFDANGDLTIDRPNNPVAVAAIQQALRDLHFELEVTGFFDESTAAQVRQFKHDQSLTTTGAITDDGVAGPGTMRRLDELFSKAREPDPPPSPTPLPTGDGEFRIKLMEGVSASLGAGIFQYTFVVWDPSRSKAGVFDYQGAVAGGGVGSPFSGESDWADFSLDPSVHVDHLSPATVSHRRTDAAVASRLTLEVSPAHAPDFVVQFDGLALGIGLEIGTGTWNLDGAGVRPFDG